MSAQLELAKSRLFGNGGFGVENIKFFPGTDRDATPDQVSEQVNMAISNIEAGHFDFVEDSELED